MAKVVIGEIEERPTGFEWSCALCPIVWPAASERAARMQLEDHHLRVHGRR